jgi:glycine/D-amino acid oxidase-like deaminating enzyme
MGGLMDKRAAVRLNETLWEATACPAPGTEALAGEIDTEILIVGAGYTGLSAALHIAKEKRDVTVVEAFGIGHGGSGRNAGHCTPTFQHKTLAALRKRWGPVWGERVIGLQTGAAAYVFELIRAHGIDCDGSQNGFLQCAHSPSAMLALSARRAEYQQAGLRGWMVDRKEVAALTGSPGYFGGWLLESAGHLNPLGYARGLAKAALHHGARIHTGSPLISVASTGQKWRATTPGGVINAGKIIFATGAYTGDIWPDLSKTFLLARVACMASFPLAEKYRKLILPKNNHMLDTHGDFTNVRLDRDGRLVTSIFVEGRRGGDPAGTMKRMSDHLARIFPKLPRLEWQFYWFGNVDLHPATFPQFMDLAPGVTAAMGYSSRGVPTATVMGRELARHALGADPDELNVPIVKMRAVPQVLSFAPRVLLPYYRLRDRAASWLDSWAPGATAEDIR